MKKIKARVKIFTITIFYTAKQYINGKTKDLCNITSNITNIKQMFAVSKIQKKNSYKQNLTTIMQQR